jgi:DNA-binding transcriptional regulator YdaS (Cro superfamily)
MTPTEALQKAIDEAGSQSLLADAIGTTQPRVSEWLNEAKQASARFVIAIEAVTGVSRHELRPDVFGEPASTMAEAS